MVAHRITLRDSARTDYNRYLPAGRSQYLGSALTAGTASGDLNHSLVLQSGDLAH
jgi:hypothetical protein